MSETPESTINIEPPPPADDGPDPRLRQCTNDRCQNLIRPPWRRPVGVRHDYCSDDCRPDWLHGEDHALGYTAPRPLDVWVRSGASATVAVPVGPPLPSTLPPNCRTCLDCGTAVHLLHEVRGLCADCVIEHVKAKNAAVEELLAKAVAALPSGN